MKSSMEDLQDEVGDGNDDGDDLVKLTNEDEQWNGDVAHVRARIEKSFGWVKNTFASLSGKEKYAGKSEELDCIVYYAFGINNYNIH